jgi:hypothetical protein
MQTCRALLQLTWKFRDGVLGATGVLALLVLLAWIVGGVNAQKANNEGSVEAFILPEADCLVQVRFADVWNSDIGKLWRQVNYQRYRSYYEKPSSVEDRLKDHFAVNPSEIESLVFVQMQPPSSWDLLTMAWSGEGRFQMSPFRDPSKYMTGTFKGTSAAFEIPANSPQTSTRAMGTGGTRAMTASGPYFDSAGMAIGDVLGQQPLVILTAKEAKSLEQAQTLASKHGERRVYKDMAYYVSRYGTDAALFINGRTMVRGPEYLLRKGIEAQAKDGKRHPRLQTMKDNANKHIFIDWQRSGVKLHDRYRQSEEQMYEDVHQLKPLLALKSKQVSFQLDKGLVIDSQIHFATSAEAEKAVRPLQDFLHLRRLTESGVVMSDLEREMSLSGDQARDELLTTCVLYFERLDAALREPTVKVDGKVVNVAVRTTADFAALQAEAREIVKEEWSDPVKMNARRGRLSRENLSEIGNALMFYNDAHRQLPPPARCDKDGKPLLSWRVLILPYLGERELFSQFKLDEPWDSPANGKLIAKMPRVFALPGAKTRESGRTVYQAVVGAGAGWELMPAAKAMHGARGLALYGMPDGTSNTVAVVEAPEGVPWTKPEDLVYEQGKALPKLGNHFGGKVNILTFDGTALTVRLPIADDDWRALITRAGGEPISESFWRRIEGRSREKW